MALAIFLATGVTMQAQDRSTQYKVRNAISVRTPIMNDSINPKGEKHTKKMLLLNPGRTGICRMRRCSRSLRTQPGISGCERADKDNKLYLVKTQIRAERFLKGKSENHLPRPLGSLHRRSLQASKGCGRRQHHLRLIT